jgi:opacity protein-like surface antigen
MFKKISAAAIAAPFLLPINANALDLSMLKDVHVAVGGGGGLTARKFNVADVNGNFADNRVKQDSLRFYNFEVGKKFGDFIGSLEIIHTSNATFKLYPNNNSLTGKLRTTAALFNVNFDFEEENSLFTPYFGFGLGLSKSKADNIHYAFPVSAATWDTSASKASGVAEKIKQRKSFKFAWKVGLGTHLKLRDHVFLNFSYHYANLGKAPERYALTSNTGAQNTVNIFKGLERRFHLLNVQIVYKF